MRLTALLRRWLLRPPAWTDAELAFKRQAGTAAPVAWLDWWPALSLVAVGLLLLGMVTGVGWLPAAWLEVLQGAWVPSAGWGLLVAVPTLVTVMRARRARTRLAAAYAAADNRLGQLFLCFPSSLAGTGVLLVVAQVPKLDSMAVVAAALAAQAVSELATRCLLSPGTRLRMAGQVVRQGLRSQASLWLLLAIVAVWSLPPSPVPEPGTDHPADQLRSDPVVAASDAALQAAFAAARQNSAAPHDLLRLRARWDNTHRSDNGAEAALRANALVLDRLHAFQAFWADERDRPYGRSELARRCDTFPPDPPCLIQGEAAPVPGSGGTLLSRVARRGDPADATFGDTLLGRDMMDVFQAAGPDAWRLVLRVAHDPSRAARAPRQVAAPAGTVLVLPPASPWSIQVGEMEGGNQVFLREGEAWHRLDTTSWLRQAAQALPPHQCLLQTTYGVDNMPLATELEPDYATLSLQGLYGPQSGNLDRVNGRVAFVFAVQDGVLVLRQSTLIPYPDPRPWWRRWLASGPGC